MAGDAAIETIGRLFKKALVPDNILIRYGRRIEFLLVVPKRKRR